MITRRAHVRRTGAARPLPVSCPSCGWSAESAADKAMLRDELLTEWWAVDPLKPETITTTQKYCHNSNCRPADVHLVACERCGDGPLLAGELAALTLASKPVLPPLALAPAALSPQPALPPLVAAALTAKNWRFLADVRGKGPGWVCCR